jgi:hypothetical protein
MRRPLIVLVTFLLLSAVVIVVIRLRVTGAIVLPQEAATAQDAAPVAWPSIESETTPAPLPPPPPPAAGGSTTPDAPPEGWVWWGSMAFHKDAKIQSNWGGRRGYEVPVQYDNDGALIVASKYRDHSACIWSYDTASAEFVVHQKKTRQSVGRFLYHQSVNTLVWTETAREYAWEQNKESGRAFRRGSKGMMGSLHNGARGDRCYFDRPYGEQSEGLVFKSATLQGLPIPLNNGALEMVLSVSKPSVAIPFTKTVFPQRQHTWLTVYDPVTMNVVGSLSADAVVDLNRYHDFGKGLFLGFYHFTTSGAKPQCAALLTYPDMRVVARGSLPALDLQLMASAKDGLALDVITLSAGAIFEHDLLLADRASATPQQLYRIRVPDDWRRVPGRKDLASIWQEPAQDLAALEVTEVGAFDVGTYDAHECLEVRDESEYKNITPAYAFRDGVMYWRKRHTGEVVMASVDNLDTQTVIGGEGATWDGFRVNPARDEVVTWRENGELVFWNVQFPTAEPLYKARVITDETPHRLEAM